MNCRAFYYGIDCALEFSHSQSTRVLSKMDLARWHDALKASSSYCARWMPSRGVYHSRLFDVIRLPLPFVTTLQCRGFEEGIEENTRTRRENSHLRNENELADVASLASRPSYTIQLSTSGGILVKYRHTVSLHVFLFPIQFSHESL